MLFINKSNKRGLPNGIKYENNKYYATYNLQDLGCFNTLDEAYSKYANAKETNIKKIAEEYKNIIPTKLYNALQEYKVNINNDKNYNKMFN